MKSLKLTKEEKKSNGCCEVTQADRDDYPWGTVISLDDDSMKKLGLKAKDFKDGQTFTITAKVKVKEVRVVDHNGKTDQSMELQITDLDMPKKKTSSQKFHERNNAGPGEES